MLQLLLKAALRNKFYRKFDVEAKIVDQSCRNKHIIKARFKSNSRENFTYITKDSISNGTLFEIDGNYSKA